MTTMIRQRDQIFDTREEALAAGYPDAEYGWWVPSNGNQSRARWGWIALGEREERIEMADIIAWRWTDGGSDIEVRTDAGWTVYSTGPNVETELAELRAAGVPQE